MLDILCYFILLKWIAKNFSERLNVLIIFVICVIKLICFVITVISFLLCNLQLYHKYIYMIKNIKSQHLIIFSKLSTPCI